VFFNSELASVKAHDREVTQQARYAQDEVIWLPCDSNLLKVVGDLNCFFHNSFKNTPRSFQRNHFQANQKKSTRPPTGHVVFYISMPSFSEK